ncbi:MAG: FHA domain-containing protein, partial [Myxococcales bacterium]|nr:FHA domain-containing protein [Myxococcales bacterium]
ESAKVTDMHLAQARAERDIDGRIRALRNARAFVGDDDEREAMVLRLLARALQDRGRKHGAATSEGRRDLAEAAGLFEESDAFAAAGEAFLELDDRDRAAMAFSKGGLVERVEEVLAEQEREQSRTRRLEDRFRDYELFMQGGQREEALEALEACVEAAERKGDYRRLLSDLRGRVLAQHRLPLDIGGKSVLLVGRFPLVLGRDGEAGLPVRGPSVSREHAEIRWDEEAQRYLIADRDSRNGTKLAGVDLGGVVALPPSARIDLGDSCRIDASVVAGESTPILRLEVKTGIDRGKLAVAAPGAIPLAACTAAASSAADGSQPSASAPASSTALVPSGAASASVRFERGRPQLGAPSGTLLRLNGAQVAGPVQLIRGDRVEVGTLSIVVEEG